MKKQEKIKEIIHTGKPKICVPVTGKTEQEIFLQAEQILMEEAVDLAEWRMDFYEFAEDSEKIIHILEEMDKILPDLPFLVTLRTKEEGGEQEISFEDYKKLLLAAAESGYADFIDVEVYKQREQTAFFVEQLHKKGILVIGSSHDFQKTPSGEVLESRLEEMIQIFKTDIPKIAVMPVNPKDVAVLLLATARIKEKYPNQPVITMSMSGLGCISRMSGEIFGSAVTFASLGKISAPGQLPVSELKQILEYLHNNR